MDILLIVTIALLLWFWWDSSGTKEIATRQAKAQCEASEVMFLDDSVALSQLRLRRIPSGSMLFFRQYIFEFCTDGQQRYAGYVEMLGKTVLHTHMDAYRVMDDV